MQFGLLLLACSGAYAKYLYNPMVESPVANTVGACPALVAEKPCFPGVLPRSKTVTAVDFLKCGAATSAYRKAMKKIERCNLNLKEPVVLCTKKSACKSITFDKFFAAVVDTVKTVSNNNIKNLGCDAKMILENIYNTACKQNATIDQLVTFTTTALHNLYLFTWFPVHAPHNNVIGKVGRGLMQWTSESGYSKLTSVSTFNYLKTPSYVNMLNKETIADEFAAYLSYYNNCKQGGLKAFISTIVAFASPEYNYVTEKAATEILMGEYKPTNELQQRVLRRFNIYYTMCSKIFVKDGLFVRITEN